MSNLLLTVYLYTTHSENFPSIEEKFVMKISASPLDESAYSQTDYTFGN